MRTIAGTARWDAVGCAELERMGLVETADCCGRCHHADGYASGPAAGPCHVALPDGRVASVCCASKRRLLEGREAKVPRPAQDR